MSDAATSQCVSPQNSNAGTAQHKVISQAKGATLLLSRVNDAGSETSVRARVSRV